MKKRAALLFILLIGVLMLNIHAAFADKIEYIKSPTLSHEDVKDLLDLWLAEKKMPANAEKKQHKLIGIYQKDMDATVFFFWSYVDPTTGNEHIERGRIDLIRLSSGQWFDPVEYTLLFKRVKE